MRILRVTLALACLGGCMPMGAPSQQINDIARDTNIAMRFGRMDVAMDHVAESHRAEFIRTRADWGKDLRVLDVELSRLELKTPETAEVCVDVNWVRMDEGMLRSTRVKQHWQNAGNDWAIESEERVSGDVGLLGEEVVFLRPDTQRDVHFPTKTLGKPSE